MFGKTNHATFIDTWERECSVGPSPEALRHLYDAALRAIWNRSLLTLGDATLNAIFDRVLFGCKDRFGWLDDAALKADNFSLAGIDISLLSVDELRQGLRSILTELLDLLGSLTGNALTPQLHLELAKIRSAEKTKRAAEAGPAALPGFKGRTTN